MTHGSLFSGIGGFDLAAGWMGWQNVFHCEWNEFGKKVLKYYWPKSISYHDITKTDFTIHRGSIDILSGGFPCQPYSSAGKRLGKEDERHLWPEMLRAIREIQPSWVVGENVRGLTNWNGGLVFNEVQADLESEGYEVLPFLLPACAVNAPHRRDRIWFIAYSSSNGHKNRCEETGGKKSSSEQWRVQQSERMGGEWNASDTDNKRLERDASKRIQTNERRSNRVQNGIFDRMGKQSKWETFPTVSPICNGDDGLSDRLDSITFPKWRNESIKAGGNAVVPQVVYQIFKAIEQYNNIRLM